MLEYKCPNCNTMVNRLYPQCNFCGINLSTLIQISDRISALESAAYFFLEDKNYINAHRAFSVLLEYKSDIPKYMIGYARSTIGLGNTDIAEEVFKTLSQRFEKNKDVENLKEIINSSKT